MVTAFHADNQWIIVFNAIMDLTALNVKTDSSLLTKETAVRKKSKAVPSHLELTTTTDSSTLVLNVTRSTSNSLTMRQQETINVSFVLSQSLDARSAKDLRFVQSVLMRILIMKHLDFQEEEKLVWSFLRIVLNQVLIYSFSEKLSMNTTFIDSLNARSVRLVISG